MTETQHVRLSRFVRRCVSCIEDAGLKFRLGHDFEELAAIVEKEEARSPLAPIFDPSCGHVGKNDAFWVAAFNKRGELVITEALMLIDIGTERLVDHLSKHLDWYRPPCERVCCERSTLHLSSAAHLTGRLVYNGEMWIKSKPDNYRGSSLIGLVPRLVMAHALAKWNPDHIFGLVETGSAMKGLSVRCGFTHLEQGSIDWHDNTRPQALQEWITWLDASDAEHLMAIAPERVHAMLGGIPDFSDRSRHSATAA